MEKAKAEKEVECQGWGNKRVAILHRVVRDVMQTSGARVVQTKEETASVKVQWCAFVF